MNFHAVVCEIYVLLQKLSNIMIPHIIFKLLCYKASNYTDISIIRYYKCQIQICDYQYLHWILEHSIILSTNIF